MAYKVIILYRLYMPSYFLGTFTEYPSHNKGKKKIACPDNDFLVVQAGYYMYLKNYFSGVFSNVAVRKS